MKLRFASLSACVVVLVFAVACSQSDGPLPVAQGDTPNRLQDLAKDLQNIVNGDREAPKDLADDLTVFVDKPAEPATRDLAQRTAMALQKTRLPDAQAQQLANQLWVAVTATQISGPQRRTLQDDTKKQLTTIGASDQNATSVAAAIDNVQKVVNTRKRRWYERG
jgi:hypothetical protein